MNIDVKLHTNKKTKTDIRMHETKGGFAVIDIYGSHNSELQLFISDIEVINTLINTLNETKERLLVIKQDLELETNSKE